MTLPGIPRHSFFAAAMGTTIEYYDYALFSLFLPIIAPLFFPAESIYGSLIKGYYVLMIVTLFRPLGGLFFGSLGDVLGRRKALLSSMYGIALSTLMIGLTPSYAHIGVASVILLVIAKSAQVFCFGGEYNGAGIYVVEHSASKNEAYIGSLLTATMKGGSLLATLIGVLLTCSFMPSWSWRVAFIMGSFIGIIGIFSRKNLLESPHFKKADIKHESIVTLVKLFPYQILAGVLIGGFATIPYTTVLVFLAPVLMTKKYITTQEFMFIQSGLTFLACLFLVVAGRIADKLTPYKVMQFGAITLVLIAFPIMYSIDKGGLLFFLIGSVLLVLINELLLGPSNAFLKNLFPMQYRYRGSSLGFTLGMSLLGGLTPIVENALYQQTGNFASVSLWLIALGLGAFVSIHLAHKNNYIEQTLCNNLSG